MKIVQITDCHLFADINKVGYNDINPYLSLQCVMSSASAYKPDLLLVTGDISGDGSRASYQHFNTLFERSQLTSPVAIIPGNHDQLDLLQTNLRAEFSWLNSPVAELSKYWEIHLLDTHYLGAKGQMSELDLAHLSEQLHTHSDKYHLLAVHHHPLPCGGWMDKHQWLNRDVFNHIVQNHTAIKAVVYGHIHTEVDTQIGQTQYLACPSSCWQWAVADSFAVCDLKPGFRVIRLSDDGQVQSTVHRIS